MQIILLVKNFMDSVQNGINRFVHSFFTVRIILLFFALFSGFCFTIQLSAQIIITEVYPQPRPGEPEWIECYNTSTASQTVLNFIIHDKVGNVATIERLTFLPQSYLVLTRDTASFRLSGLGDLTTNLVQVRNLPALNNDSDRVMLSIGTRVLDTFSYIALGTLPGISFERKDERSPAIYPENVQPSREQRGSTPGRNNSIAIADYDIVVRSIYYHAAEKKFYMGIENTGRFALAEVTVSLYLDTVRNIVPTVQQQIFTRNIPVIPRGKRIVVSNVSSPPDVVSLYALGIVTAKTDERRNNDTLRTLVYIPYPPETIRLNEIFAEPLDTPDGYNAEWIEVYNSYYHPINLFSWFISDARRDTMTITTENYIVDAHSFAIISFDSTFFRQFPLLKGLPNVYCFPRSSFTLNNDGDILRLYDPNGVQHDSVAYSARWHDASLESTRGRSLEKRSPLLPSSLSSSWTSSGALAGSTPLQPNRSGTQSVPETQITITPSPFRRNLKEYCTIEYSLPLLSARLTIKIFDVQGVFIGDILNYTYTGSKGNIEWDGRVNAQSLPSGGYILFCEAVDPHSGAVYSIKQFLVII